jgi:signal transduction histidine kinase
MASSFSGPIRRRPYVQQWVPFTVLVLGCVLTATAVTTIATRQEVATASAFRADTLAVQRVTQVQLDTVVGVTHAAAALLAASPEINFREFRAFVSGLQLRERYVGVEGIGFAPRVPAGNLRTFVRSISLDGMANLKVRPDGNRSQYFPAALLEPRDDDNSSTIGFDLGSEPEQLDAMNRARDSDLPAVTELLEPNPAAGRSGREFVLYLPIYRRGQPIESIEQRRRALVGFVFSRLSPDVIFSDSIAAATVRYLDIAIYDSSKDTDALLVRSGDGKGNVQSSATLMIGGRQWLLVASSRQVNMASLPPEAQRTFVVGALVSLLLFALMRAQVRAWQTAERHATELRAADRAKDEFLAVLSHELRTPLNVVVGWLSMLRNGSVREDRRAHALDIIDRNARTQAQLIDDLLEVSRILMGKMRIDKHPLSVVPAITAVLESLRPAADAKDVTLHGIDAAAAGTFIIAADAGRFAQIITNLVANGVKFTQPGGAVWVNVEAEDEHVKISVRDTGIGIDPEFLPYVFDRFRQADASPTRSHNGLGMGLAIVRDLVRLHGGRIDVYSAGLNQGAVFVITLPLIPADGTHEGGAELALVGT